MLRKIILLVCMFLNFGIVKSQSNYVDPFKFEFKKIADDIYLAYRPQPLKVLVECNSTIIINENDIVVFDATGSPKGAKQIVEKIKVLTDKPVRYLINSHGHGDHTLGNQEFVKAFPGCEIIARQETRKYMLAPKGSKGKDRGIAYVYEYSVKEELEKRIKYINDEIEKVKKEAKPGYEKVIQNLTEYLEKDFELRKEEYNNVEVIAPSLTLENKLVLYRGKRELQILYMGKGDTQGDIWLYLPNEKILCSPDAVVHPIPYGFSRNPVEWIETLKKVKQIDFNILIPGHGEVQHDKKYLSLVIELLETIKSQINKAIEKGLTVEETQEFVIVDNLKKEFVKDDPVKSYYFDGYTKEPIIARMYAELTNTD